MAGMEGYFGPRSYNPSLSYRETYDDLEYDLYSKNDAKRPNNIELQQSFPRPNVNMLSPIEYDCKSYILFS